MIIFILYLFIFFPFVIFFVVINLWLLFIRPRIVNLSMHNALILAAHPDDCVIMAGEYGIKALQAGKLVNIIYMTCGDICADSDYARIRHSEALFAWSKARLPPENIMFIDAPESKLRGAANQDDICKLQIKKSILDAVSGLPMGSKIFIPAAGESHVDHRTLRKQAITAILESNRQDIEVYEAPEYSNYCSLICNPFGAIRNIFRLLPGGWRIAKFIVGDSSFTTFGTNAIKLPYDQHRLNLKCEMLKAFVSQNSDKMCENFCRPDVFRPINLRKMHIKDENFSGIELNGIVYSQFTFLFIVSIFLSLTSLFFLLVIQLLSI